MNSELGAGYRDAWEGRPVSVVGVQNVVALAAGYHFSLALLADGTVKAWGGNTFHQLGDGTNETSLSPVVVSGLGDVSAISAAGAHALARLDDGILMAWGSNEFGELGNGLLNPRRKENGETTMQGTGAPVPVAVPGLSNVTTIASGGGTNYALLANGTVLAWGRNDKGQLGIGTTGPEVCKTEVGEVLCSTKPRPVLVREGEPLRHVLAISGGGEAAYALLAGNTVMAWGSDAHGQLGNGTTISSSLAQPVPGLTGVMAVEGGAKHALALLNTGHVVAWGSNASGGLGGPSSEVCQQVPCSTRPQPVSGLAGITAVSAGFGFSLALDGAGRVYAFGYGQFGRLGNGTQTDSQVPVAIQGLSPVSRVLAGEQNSLALIPSGVTPPPLMTLSPVSKALELAWSFGSHDYELRYTPFDENAWSTTVTVGQAQPHRYVFSGLSVKPYEVNLTTDEKTRYIVGTPLP